MSGLLDYQPEGVMFLRARKNALLSDDYGLGKSAQTLRALDRRDRAVVCCPASVAMTWEVEAHKFRPDLYVTVGADLRRPNESEILIVSYDSLPDPPSGFSSRLVLENMNDVTLVGDEIHMAKSADAKRTQKFRRLGNQCRRRWGLSATPMLGNPEDLWGVLVSLNIAFLCFESREEFVALCGGKKRFITDKRTHQLKQIGYEWGTISPEVRECLKPFMLRRLRRDVLNLPDAHYIDVPVAAPEDLREYLDEVKEQWDAVGPDDMPPFELLSEAMAALARARIPQAVEYAQNMAESVGQILVFSAHVEPIQAVGKLRGCATITGETSISDRKKAVEKFQKGKTKILALTIAAGGVGLNLQNATGVLFIDRDYTPSMNAQAEGRAVRQGQRNNVVIARMRSDHPLDVNLQRILDNKTRMIGEAVGL